MYNYFSRITLLSIMVCLPSYIFAAESSPAASSASNFERLEKLDEQIQMANKEISALQMKQQLSKLQLEVAKQEQGFILVRIYGVEGKMFAVFKLGNDSDITVSQGDIIKGNYKAVLINENGVTIENTETGERFPAPRG